VADLIQKETGIKPELVYGDRGEFSVLVDGKIVAKKGMILFPSPAKVVAAVKAELTG
jgi:hypothetical protein